MQLSMYYLTKTIGFDAFLANLYVIELLKGGFNMEISFNDLQMKLEKYNPKFHLNSNVMLQDYLIMQKNMVEFQSDCVYVAKPDDIPVEFRIGNLLNIILITQDSKVPPNLFDNKINLIIIENKPDTAEILNDLYTIFHSEKRLLLASSKLLSLLSQGCKLQEILDLGSELIGNPILLVDMSTSLLAYSGISDSIDEPAWDSHIKNGYITQEYYKLYEKEARSAYSNSDKNSPILLESKIWKHRIILHKAIYQQSVLGFIEVLEYNKSFHRSDFDVIKLIGNAIGIVLQRSSYHSNFPESTIDASYINLLMGKPTNNEQLSDLTNYLSIESNDHMFMLCIDLKSLIDANSKILYLKNKFERIVPRNYTVMLNEQIILLLVRKDRHLHQPELLQIQHLLTENNLIAGISRSFQDLNKLYSEYLKAQAIIEIGKYMEMNKSLFIYDNYMPYHLLSLTSETSNLLEICSPELLDLIEYDKAKKTEYSMSLYYFIINNLNMQKTSDILHIHYNTLKYRLQRIEEFHSLDLSSERVQLNLRLSFLILEHINKTDFMSFMGKVMT